MFFTYEKPLQGYSPKSMELPAREKEEKDEMNWQTVFSQFSCVIGNIWLARKKKTSAWFFSQHYLEKGQLRAVIGG